MNKKNGINAITVKIRTSEPAATRQMALTSLGGEEVYAEPGLCIIKLRMGGILEIYGPGSNYPDYLFKKNDTVICYGVEDLDYALSEAEYSGMKRLSSGQANGNCYRYFHLSDNEGNLIELQQAVT